jgi:hypothetical protein
MEYGICGIGLISWSARGGYAVHEMKCNGAMLVGCRRRLQLQRSTYLKPAILLAILVDLWIPSTTTENRIESQIHKSFGNPPNLAVSQS